MMIINKVTHGFVSQSYDTVAGKFISQEFTAGDDVEYDYEEGSLVNGEIDNDDIPYLPFFMVQPE